jgi:hypothetical protein
MLYKWNRGGCLPENLKKTPNHDKDCSNRFSSDKKIHDTEYSSILQYHLILIIFFHAVEDAVVVQY